ncbi:hypothetical protein HanPSC8_Chr14g0609161 [Helianthus annuus]|nr:hypothetical protein HanPSC8_Chr14g0609161 [Helianthus annuus]
MVFGNGFSYQLTIAPLEDDVAPCEIFCWFATVIVRRRSQLLATQ